MRGPEEDTITTEVRINGVWVTALVDCGAAMNYIQPELVNKLALPWKHKKFPYEVSNLEGTPFSYDEGRVLREIDHLKVLVEGRNQGVDFDILDVEDYPVVLGRPWLRRHNPDIDWEKGQMRWRDASPQIADSDGHDPRSQASIGDRNNDEVTKEETTDTSSPPKGTKRKHQQGKMRHIKRVIAFIRKQFRQMDKDLEEQKKQRQAEEERLKNVPLRYRIYEKLFKEELETGLPEPSEWDLEIVLKDGTNPKFFPIYNLNNNELTTLREYIQEMERKGYIQKSKSSAGYPVMFVPKKNGKLRLCVDYRQLNSITEKDRTPLPLIPEMRDRLHGAKWFTALDLKGAYNLIRIKQGHEWKTAFRTKFGLYEYLVMPFGLTNAPAAFQRMITNVLREHLDIFVVCYLDDILIFSENEEDHERHVHTVLQKLQDANLLVEPEKSNFHASEVEFLGHIISHNQVRMDPKKIAAVREWKQPENLTELQSFLGFANYYRRFIKHFSKHAIPLTRFMKKGVKFKWDDEAERAFQTIKDVITSEPILASFDPDKEIELETDASGFALGGQIGQRDENGLLHPIAFYSYKMHGPELNYPIYDQEFLAIVNCFKEFRHYLLGSNHKVKVYTDHKNISYFATTQKLSGRQLRYAEYLSEFDYTIIHVKGSENGRADAISRRADFDTGKIKASEQIFSFTPEGHLQQKYLGYIHQRHECLPRVTLGGTYHTTCDNELLKKIEQHNQTYEMDRVTGNPCPIPASQLEPRKLQVPTELQEQLVREIHSHTLHGHQGVTKTLERVKTTYTFPRIKKVVQDVIRQCSLCAKTKARRHKPYGELQPLPVAQRPWHSITMDFITKLPLSEDPATGAFYDSILVIVDRFTKFSYFVPYREATDAEEFAYVFNRNIVSVHGLPVEILTDRGPPFTSKFWQALMAQLGLNHRLTTAFRPQVDGQTERTNQILEQYLRCYINYEQNDWVEKLPMAQLSYNTATHESTKLTPAFANFGFTPDAYHRPREGIINPHAILTSDKLKNLHEELRTELEFVRNQMRKYYDPKRMKGPSFSEGDMVLLATKNVSTDRPSKKLDYKFIGPYKVLEKISENNYRLDLKSKKHPVFHISLLEPFENTIMVNNGHDHEPQVEDPEEYHVEEIREMKKIDGQTKYLVKWKDYPESETSWEPPGNLNHAQRLLKAFHARHRKARKDRSPKSSSPP